MLSDRSLSGVSNLRPRAGYYYPSTYLNTHTYNRSQTRTRKTRRKVRPEGGLHVWSNKCYDRWKMHEPIAKALPHAIPRAWCRFYDTWFTTRYAFSSTSLRTDREIRSDDESVVHKYDIPTSGGTSFERGRFAWTTISIKEIYRWFYFHPRVCFPRIRVIFRMRFLYREMCASGYEILEPCKLMRKYTREDVTFAETRSKRSVTEYVRILG